MSKQDKSPSTPEVPEVKLPEGARLSRHGNVILNGTEPVREEQ
jgi:hypothetical protein